MLYRWKYDRLKKKKIHWKYMMLLLLAFWRVFCKEQYKKTLIFFDNYHLMLNQGKPVSL